VGDKQRTLPTNYEVYRQGGEKSVSAKNAFAADFGSETIIAGES